MRYFASLLSGSFIDINICREREREIAILLYSIEEKTGKEKWKNFQRKIITGKSEI